MVELIIETVICLIFGLIVTILGLNKVLTGQHLTLALIIWALLAPSPSKWVIKIGKAVFLKKNGEDNHQGVQPQQEVETPSEQILPYQ